MKHVAKLAHRSLRLRPRAKRGLAAIEFALTLPIWIALLIGSVDSAYMMILSQRVDRISYSVTDIVAQSQTAVTTNLDIVLLAAGQLMEPFTFGADGVVIITSVLKQTGKAAEICWQHPGGGSLQRGSKIGVFGVPPTLPDGFTLNDNENVIISEVYYAFKPMFINSGIFAAGDMYRAAVYKPRLNALTALVGGTKCQ
jgi:hypothetical protein